ncbi:MAG: anti-sigma factor [Acidobacteria bacterium]|nr:anti-sigma factor [Acidobacteriota bacterium]
MNGETHPEDLTILAAVAALERGSEAPPGAPRTSEVTEAEQTLARLYTEVLGLIPYELEPVAPAPDARARLLAAVRGEKSAEPTATPEARDNSRPTLAEPIRLTSIPLQTPRPEPTPTRSAPPAAGPVRTTTQEMRVPRPTSLTPPPRRVVRPARWPLALAASLALLFAGLSGWLYTQLGQQGETIEALGRQLDRERSQALRDARQAKADALSLQEKFALVTSPAVEASPMRPPGASPLQPAARGVLFVAADHQHWYLCLHGVAPAPEGKTYKLWFVADPGNPVSGGTFTAKPGAPVELSSKQMPAGTKAVMVTLEADPQAEKPAGPEVLRAAGVYQLS